MNAAESGYFNETSDRTRRVACPEYRWPAVVRPTISLNFHGENHDALC